MSATFDIDYLVSGYIRSHQKILRRNCTFIICQYLLNNKSTLSPTAPSFTPLKLQIIHESYTAENFIPSNTFRAKSNIFISLQFTKQLMNMIKRPYTNSEMLYYFIDHSTTLQIHDQKAKKYSLSGGDVLLIFNYDLFDKTTGECLYGIIKPIDVDKKYKWKMEEMINKQNIFKKYGIAAMDLPYSSRMYGSFRRQITNKITITSVDIDGIDCKTISKKFTKYKKFGQSISVSMKSKLFKMYVKKSMTDNELIPIVVINKNKYRIEWVLIVEYSLYFGVSFKCDNNGNITSTSLYLDKFDIIRKNILTGVLLTNNQKKLLNRFTINIDEFIVGNDDDQENTIKQLKEFNKQTKIRNTQLSRMNQLYESYLRDNNLLNAFSIYLLDSNTNIHM